VPAGVLARDVDPVPAGVLARDVDPVPAGLLARDVDLGRSVAGEDARRHWGESGCSPLRRVARALPYPISARARDVSSSSDTMGYSSL